MWLTLKPSVATLGWSSLCYGCHCLKESNLYTNMRLTNINEQQCHYLWFQSMDFTPSISAHPHNSCQNHNHRHWHTSHLLNAPNVPSTHCSPCFPWSCLDALSVTLQGKRLLSCLDEGTEAQGRESDLPQSVVGMEVVRHRLLGFNPGSATYCWRDHG